MKTRSLLTGTLVASIAASLILTACVPDSRSLTLTITNGTDSRLCSNSSSVEVRPCHEQGCLDAQLEWEDFEIGQECLEPGQKWTIEADFSEDSNQIWSIELGGNGGHYQDSWSLRWPDENRDDSAAGVPRLLITGLFSPPTINNNGNPEPGWLEVDYNLARDRVITQEMLDRAMQYGQCRLRLLDEDDQVCW